MARRLNVQRLIWVLGAVVLVLGALSVWAATRGRPVGAAQPPAAARALQQVREQRGRDYEVRYAEAGQGRALCGYAGPRRRGVRTYAGIGGYDAVAFVSRPNRILFSDDPLPGEFREMRERFCPGFLVTPRFPAVP